jgi:hypothetical protein
MSAFLRNILSQSSGKFYTECENEERNKEERKKNRKPPDQFAERLEYFFTPNMMNRK